MAILDQLVEQRILEASERVEFDDLPGAGRVLGEPQYVAKIMARPGSGS